MKFCKTRGNQNPHKTTYPCAERRWGGWQQPGQRFLDCKAWLHWETRYSFFFWLEWCVVCIEDDRSPTAQPNVDRAAQNPSRLLAKAEITLFRTKDKDFLEWQSQHSITQTWLHVGEPWQQQGPQHPQDHPALYGHSFKTITSGVPTFQLISIPFSQPSICPSSRLNERDKDGCFSGARDDPDVASPGSQVSRWDWAAVILFVKLLEGMTVRASVQQVSAGGGKSSQDAEKKTIWIPKTWH